MTGNEAIRHDYKDSSHTLLNKDEQQCYSDQYVICHPFQTGPRVATTVARTLLDTKSTGLNRRSYFSRTLEAIDRALVSVVSQ